MAFMLSPGVQVTEKDLTTVVPAVATSNGAFAGVFRWGPVMDPVVITSENELVQRYGAPTLDPDLGTSFFTAANFLAYSNNLLLTRVFTSGMRNAVAIKTGTVTGYSITEKGTEYSVAPTLSIPAPTDADGVQATATAVLKKGYLSSITITTAGSGYVDGTRALVIDDPVTGTDTAVGTVTISGGAVTAISITNEGSGYDPDAVPSVSFAADGGDSPAPAAVLTAVVEIGRVESIEITNPGTGYTVGSVSVTVTPDAGDTITTDAVITLTVTETGVVIKNANDYDVNWSTNTTVGQFAAKYPGSLGNAIKVHMADSGTYNAWAWKEAFDGAPTGNELHILLEDTTGAITGTAGGVIEKFAFLSKKSNGRRADGTNTYYAFVLNNTSKWIWWMDHPTGLGGDQTTSWGNELTGTATALSEAVAVQLSGGVDDYAATEGQKQNGFALFANSEAYDVNLIIAGKCTTATAIYIINYVAEVRKDCVAFVSPINVSTGEPIIGTGTSYADQINAYRNALPSSSYAVMDSGFKYQYDRYNDVYRWVPLNADIAGLCARTDFTDDPWFSPGGYNRGQIKGVVKLSFNPDQTSRDMLYKNGVNPVVSFPGQGTVLYGDKTLLSRPSAFDRINVRRLFIVLEKAISTAAKYQLFEFNDQFTRAQFRALVEPFLRDVQGRRGITDFRVKCDETNNTGEVIDSNRFVADIYIKPARSINFITLNFIAVRTGVSFEEIGA